MAKLNIEEIYETLFLKLKATPGIKTSSRRLQSIADVQVSNRPYLSIQQGKIGQETKSNPNLPTKWVVNCDVIIYTAVGSDPNIPSVIPLNNIVSSIIAMMEPDPGSETNRLGLSYVYSARIQGDILMLDDVMEGDGIAAIPIRIVSA